MPVTMIRRKGHTRADPHGSMESRAMHVNYLISEVYGKQLKLCHNDFFLLIIFASLGVNDYDQRVHCTAIQMNINKLHYFARQYQISHEDLLLRRTY